MNKYIKNSIKLLTILTCIFLLCGCNFNNNELKEISGDNEIQITDNQNNSDNTKTTRYSKDIDLNAVKQTIITTGDMHIPKTLETKAVSDLYGLEELNGLESLIVIEETENSYQEVAIVKLLSEDQSDKILEKFILRYEQIKEEKPEFSNILNVKENIVIKQQAGVGIFIASENCSQLNEAIDNYFKR